MWRALREIFTTMWGRGGREQGEEKELKHELSPFEDHPHTSPLKKFTQAKESISRIFTRICEVLAKFKSVVESVPGNAHKVS